ncbi:hypothetical protein DRN69_00065 [Candidatus Pacearchaeota archaeon]|nr:MAG: hypothetical protein DRN69_00065 [Candidatus Pacearchaeota archaeon]
MKITEQSLYPPLVGLLKDMGIKSVSEVSVGRKRADIYFKLNSEKFVLEVKIDEPNTTNVLNAFGQAYDYAKRIGTGNIVIMLYPSSIRNVAVIEPEVVERVALNQPVKAWITTQFESFKEVEGKAQDVFETLKELLVKKKKEISFDEVVRTIRNCVKEMNSVIYQVRTKELVSEVVNKLELFATISGMEKDTERQVVYLGSYLLFNQLLFYHIYSCKTGKVPKMETVSSVKELEDYFEKILNIDYRAIYSVNIVRTIPDNDDVVKMINNVIKALKMIKVEHISHDLAGRFFHELIPYEVRKVFAAFYTNPTAGDLLAKLTIERWDDKVIDPACGSGTLLVSAYKRKMELCGNDYSKHKRFLEEDITGIDIMPFAAHLTAINLATQNIEQETNVVRVAVGDSLELAKKLRFGSAKITRFSKLIQSTIDDSIKYTVDRKGAVSTDGKGSEFEIGKFDVVIMNPPFTDRNKMPKEMREKLKENPLSKICGNQVNLWGYFLALADLLLKEGGRIGAVIPINIARGRATEEIREFLLKNYHIKYVVKPVGFMAFSEDAGFKDVLLIAEKRKPKKGDVTKIVFVVEDDLGKINLDVMVNDIKKCGKGIVDYGKYIVWVVSSLDFASCTDTFMMYLRGRSPFVADRFIRFWNWLRLNPKLRKITSDEMFEGVSTYPEGISSLMFIGNPLDRSRVKRNVIMRVKSVGDRKVFVDTDIGEFEIPIGHVKPAIRTLTSVKSFSGVCDYILTGGFNDFDKVVGISKFKDEFDLNDLLGRINGKETYCAIQRKINLVSRNTHLIVVSSDRKFYTTDAFHCFKWNCKEAKIQTLLLNSVVGLSQIVLLAKETTGAFSEIGQLDLQRVSVFNISKLNDNDIGTLLKLYNKLKDVEFPSIKEQLERRFWARVELDRTVLKVLGLSDAQIDKLLPKLYDGIVDVLSLFD